ncbi:MAG: hypothetical protein JSU69_04895 [Candidatus Zixiibacteriota bacterium]|nr:MAG: hypothetical protein JSU69_04895 [candidate division Zixibacteria bacterium]
MTRKFTTILIVALLLIAFLAVTSYGMHYTSKKKGPKGVLASSLPKYKLAGAEKDLGTVSSQPSQPLSLGFDVSASQSPGLTVGYTTYDYQSNGRMNRQVAWRGDQNVHFAWMKQSTRILGDDRGTGYEIWDSEYAQLVHAGAHGGCDVHPRLGEQANYSGYVGLDVDPEGRAVVSNHHKEAAEYSSTIWWDNVAGACFFGPGKYRVPDSFWQAPVLDYPGDPEHIWPNHEVHAVGGDTVVHLFANQGNTTGSQGTSYTRHVGGYSAGVAGWQYPPMMIDTTNDLSSVVTASRKSGKVALVWIANLPEVEGDGESANTGSQRENDLYYAVSSDMGATWGPGSTLEKFNVTKSSMTQPGWRLHCDVSALIDTGDVLHIIWDAFPWSPVGGGTLVNWPVAGRLFHWDDNSDEIRVIKDFSNWVPPDRDWCYSGAWNEMAVNKMQISQCDGKFYAVFSMFNDYDHGIKDDCHNDAWNGSSSGTANGELWISVSDNGGRNWDVARNLTNTYTPHCDTIGPVLCESDHWSSISRFGMDASGANFTGVPVVDPTGSYSGTYYIDVFYVNDRYPGGAVQDKAVWTYNPMKWFRVPCVEPEPSPVLAVTPGGIYDPTWTKPGIQLDTVIRLENIGNAPLNVATILPVEITGPDGWLDVADYGPFTILESSPNFHDLTVYLNHNGTISTGPGGYEGQLEIESNNVNGTVYYDIYVIVADSVQFPEEADIRTACTRLIFNNAGGMGKGGNPPLGGYNLNHFDDCDTTDNASGADDHAGVYIYDGSPFILRVNDAGDTVFNYYMFDADWLSNDGFRPLEGLYVDSGTYADYQYGYTGKFLTKDSAIAIELEYFAPKDGDSCEFLVLKERVYNNTDAEITGVYVGEAFDWDVPSDSGVQNGSGYDKTSGENSRDFMYCYGGEWALDTTDEGEVTNDDCVLGDDRYAGMAFYNGYKVAYGAPDDSLENPEGPWWTHINADWVYPAGGFVGEQIYRKIIDMGTSWQEWQPIAPSAESVYVDLNMIAVFGNFDLGVKDTLVFVKILATENDGALAGILETVDQAREWIAGRPEIFAWPELPLGKCCYGTPPTCAHVIEDDCIDLVGDWEEGGDCSEPCGCCVDPGDADDNSAINILDVTFIINYLYKNGPTPACVDQADADGNNSVNILDVTHIINYLYKNGPDPICGTTGT